MLKKNTDAKPQDLLQKEKEAIIKQRYISESWLSGLKPDITPLNFDLCDVKELYYNYKK